MPYDTKPPNRVFPLVFKGFFAFAANHRDECKYPKVGELGFEPRLSDSESLVLPLHYSPMFCDSSATPDFRVAPLFRGDHFFSNQANSRMAYFRPQTTFYQRPAACQGVIFKPSPTIRLSAKKADIIA